MTIFFLEKIVVVKSLGHCLLNGSATSVSQIFSVEQSDPKARFVGS